jgi:uncharacterized protein (TIGR00255 family)
MIRSMTAFGRADLSTPQGNWEVEIRSLNHRYFEFSVKTPSFLNPLENRIRDLVQSEMRRGKITVSIGHDAKTGESQYPSLDENAVRFYVDSANQLKKKFKLGGELTISDIFKLPNLFEGKENNLDPEKIWPQVKKVLQKTLDNAIKAKQLEGAKLAKDIQARLQAVTKTIAVIEKYTAGQSEKIFKRISDRVKLLLEDKSLDEDRLAREAALLAERTDITEELVRMKSHLELFEKKIKQENEVGRELDFLCQEMNREVNTMTSKSQHFEISTEVVFVKGELEKIREQIQNIE